MAFRTWVKLLGAVLGVAALAGASQLGVAYGLGILRLTRVLEAAARDQWTAQLAWVAWFAMASAVIGALAGGRLREHLGGAATVGTHIAMAVAAGAGAAVVVPLTMQPARTAQVAGVDPVFVIGLCAAFGALVGVFAAYAVLAHVVARWSMSVLGPAIWAIALISVSPSLAPGDALPAVRLGVFDAGFLSPAVTQRTALFTMPALALLVGAAHGWTARRREMPTLTIALAGLPGPAMLTLAYLIAGPGSGSDRYQIVPYWAAMTATGAGVLGSVLAAVIGRGDAGAEAGEPGGARVPEQRAGSSPADDLKSSAAPSAPPVTPPGGRRSSAADAFTGRSSEWPVRRAGVAVGEYAERESEPFDAFATGARTPGAADPQAGAAPRAGSHAATAQPGGQHSAAGAEPYVPAPATRPFPPEAIQRPLSPEASRPPLLPEANQGPFRSGDEKASSTRGSGLLGRMPFGRGRGRRKDAAGAGEAATIPQPDAPAFRDASAASPLREAPAFRESGAPTSPDSPSRPPLREAPAFRDTPAFPETPTPPPTRSAPAPTWPGRQPLVPEPHAVSAPLPQPEPISPPLSVTPAPDDRRSRRKGRNDDDFVDWVSGLGTPHDDDR